MPEPIVIDQFEGPLGLLLELVERNQMPVTDIAVATITQQYLDRIAGLGGLEASELGEFLQLGTRLVYIKSLALLPNSEPEEQASELRRLGAELEEYRRYQAAARTLAGRTGRPTWPRSVSGTLAAPDLPLPTISPIDLAAAFRAALLRVAPAAPSRAVVADVSQARITDDLKQRLSHGPFELSDLLATLHDRLEVVVTFSALLELIRDGHGRVSQAGQFAPIIVEPAGD